MGYTERMSPKIGNLIYFDGADGNSTIALPTHGRVRFASLHNNAFFDFSSSLGFEATRVVQSGIERTMSEDRFVNLHADKLSVDFPEQAKPYSEDGIAFEPPLTSYAIHHLNRYLVSCLEQSDASSGHRDIEPNKIFLDLRAENTPQLPDPQVIMRERKIEKA